MSDQRFNTGNPIGSNSPLDRSDNTRNLDVAVNSEDPQWIDRFGRPRLPLMEQERQFVASQDSREDRFQSAQSSREYQFQLSQDSRDDQFQSSQSSREAVFSNFLQASGYQDLGEYAPGIEITAHNQYVTFGGQPYLLKPSIPVPYTTSGEWDGDDFKLIGDGSIRQDLANLGMGAALVAFVGPSGEAHLLADLAIPDKGAAMVGFSLNTIEEGVARTVYSKLTDFLSIKDFGGVGDGVTSDAAAGHQAMAELKRRGGGTLYFPHGDYPVNLVVDSPNIAVVTAHGTVLRASGSGTVFDVTENGINAVLDGPIISGQSKEQEGLSNAGGVQNTSALHCIRVRAQGATLRNFSTYGARYDGIYFYVVGRADALIENFKIGPTARNPVSIIEGIGFNFRRGSIRLNNMYTGELGQSGLYLFDQEHNSEANKFHSIEFYGVDFINEGTTADNWQVMFHTTNLPGNNLDATFTLCNFKKGGGATTSATVRLTDPASLTFRGIHMYGCTFEGRVLSIAAAALQAVEDSTFENLDLIGIRNFTAGVILGKGCIVRDIRSPLGPVVIEGAGGADITLENVDGVSDKTPKGRSMGGDLSVAGSLTAESSVISGGTASLGSSRIDVSQISVTDTSSFVDILRVGKRGTFKITIGGADATTGNVGIHASESWCIVSGDIAHKPEINIILNPPGAGLDVQWKDAAPGTSDDHRTLQVKPQSSAANQYTVKVETLATSLVQSSVEWL